MRIFEVVEQLVHVREREAAAREILALYPKVRYAGGKMEELLTKCFSRERTGL